MTSNIVEFIVNDYNEKKKKDFAAQGYIHNQCIRALGALEGILLAAGELTPGTPFDYRDIEYEQSTFNSIIFGACKSIKIRKQSYAELIIEKATEYTNKLRIIETTEL